MTHYPKTLDPDGHISLWLWGLTTEAPVFPLAANRISTLGTWKKRYQTVCIFAVLKLCRCVEETCWDYKREKKRVMNRMKMSSNRIVGWLHKYTHLLKIIKLYTLNGWFLWRVNFTSIGLLRETDRQKWDRKEVTGSNIKYILKYNILRPPRGISIFSQDQLVKK